MAKKNTSRFGCLAAIAFFVLIVVFSAVYHRYIKKAPSVPSGSGISWAEAVEKCKSNYEALRPGYIDAPNCRKRTEDDSYFYFTWSSPLAIYVKNDKGKMVNTAAKCQVAKGSGEIVYMRLDKNVLVNTINKK
jgi:hypothetical protein